MTHHGADGVAIVRDQLSILQSMASVLEKALERITAGIIRQVATIRDRQQSDRKGHKQEIQISIVAFLGS